MVTKFIGAGASNSSAMLSEGIHSVIDCISQLLLLWGLHQSQKKADDKRPFGYGRELYFWSFIVSLMIFTLGGCISLYEGLQKFRKPGVPGDGVWNYIVLGVAFVFTAVSCVASLKTFNKQRGRIPFWRAIKESKDPATFIVLLGDVGDLLGLPVAFVAIWLGHLLNSGYYDGIASVVIGVLLILISIVLLRESRSLLMGEAPTPRTLKRIIALVEKDKDVRSIKEHFSIYLAPEEVVLQMVAVFNDNLTTQQITAAIERISNKVKAHFPRIKQIFIEPVAL